MRLDWNAQLLPAELGAGPGNIVKVSGVKIGRESFNILLSFANIPSTLRSLTFSTKPVMSCIHDEEVSKITFEHTFGTHNGFRSRSGKPCAPPAIGHLETS